MDVQIKPDAALNELGKALKGVPDRAAIVKELRRTMREPLPEARTRVRGAALSDLPHRGGLGAWVASRTKLGAQVRVNARSSRLLVKGTPKAKTDVNAIDRGRVRHPTFGRRVDGGWQTQSVTPGFVTRTVGDEMRPTWFAAIERGVEAAILKVVSGL